MSMRFMGAVCVSLALLASSAFAQSESGLSGPTLNVGLGLGAASAGPLDSDVLSFNFGFSHMSGVTWTRQDYGTYVEGTIEMDREVAVYGIGVDLDFGILDGGEGDLFTISIPFDYVVAIDAEGGGAWPAITLGARFGYTSATFRVDTAGFSGFDDATMDFVIFEPVAALRLFNAFGILSIEAYVRIGFTVSEEFPAGATNTDAPSTGTVSGVRLTFSLPI